MNIKACLLLLQLFLMNRSCLCLVCHCDSSPGFHAECIAEHSCSISPDVGICYTVRGIYEGVDSAYSGCLEKSSNPFWEENCNGDFNSATRYFRCCSTDNCNLVWFNDDYGTIDENTTAPPTVTSTASQSANTGGTTANDLTSMTTPIWTTTSTSSQDDRGLVCHCDSSPGFHAECINEDSCSILPDAGICYTVRGIYEGAESAYSGCLQKSSNPFWEENCNGDLNSATYSFRCCSTDNCNSVWFTDDYGTGTIDEKTTAPPTVPPTTMSTTSQAVSTGDITEETTLIGGLTTTLSQDLPSQSTNTGDNSFGTVDEETTATPTVTNTASQSANTGGTTAKDLTSMTTPILTTTSSQDLPSGSTNTGDNSFGTVDEETIAPPTVTSTASQSANTGGTTAEDVTSMTTPILTTTSSPSQSTNTDDDNTAQPDTSGSSAASTKQPIVAPSSPPPDSSRPPVSSTPSQDDREKRSFYAWIFAVVALVSI